MQTTKHHPDHIPVQIEPDSGREDVLEVIQRHETEILAAIRGLTQQLNRLERRVEMLSACRHAYYLPPVRPPRNYEDEE